MKTMMVFWYDRDVLNLTVSL